MRILVVSFSRSGTVRTVAAELARQLRADVEEIKPLTGYPGVLGWLRGGAEAALGSTPTIEDPADASVYDLVVVGTPVWNWSVSSPVRAYLKRMRGQFKRVAFFATHMGPWPGVVFSQMTGLAGVVPMAAVSLTEGDVVAGRHPQLLEEFVQTLKDLAVPTRKRARTARAGAAAPPPPA